MKRPCKDFTHTGMTLDSWEFHLTIKIKLYTDETQKTN